MEKSLDSIRKLTDNPYLNLYNINYTINGKLSNYYVASRRSESELAVNNVGKTIPDAVRIVPYFKKNGEIFVVMTREFRQPINDFVYSTPAGKIETGEAPDITAVRELEEEVGGKVLSLELLADSAYTSVGLTDESVICYSAEIEFTGEANLQGCEVIESFPIALKDIPRFASEKVNDFQAKMLLKLFYYEQLEKLRNKQKQNDDLSL